MNIPLAKTIRMRPSSSVAFVGAGGKTTAMFQLARELPPLVIVTATSHLAARQIPLADKHIITDYPNAIEQIEQIKNGVVLLTGKIEGDRTNPVDENTLSQINLFCRSRAIPLLIEADGSREKPLKAWGAHEPPIPEFVDQVVQIVGMTGLGKPLTDEFVHRAEMFSKLSGVPTGKPVTAKALVQILTHENGGLKNMPHNSRRSAVLNQADTPEIQGTARSMIGRLLPCFHSVIVASLKNEIIHAVHEPFGGIVLAAGKSSRFGKPKQLLEWKGEPFVRVVAKTAIRAGLSPVVVVMGAEARQVESVVSDLDVTIANNLDWKNGQGSSTRTGVSSIHAEVGGAIFLLADQPQVNVSIIHALIEKHAQGLYPIVAPMVIDRRANPVLFDRVTFPDLMTIEGDAGGRAIFHKHNLEYLPWHDDSLLLDVDNPEQYQRLVTNEDL